MAELIDLIAMAFRDGCGVPLSSITKSERYQRTVNKYRNAPARHRETGDGNAVNLGLWEFATAVNSLGLATAREIRSDCRATHGDPKINALLELLGRQITRTVRASLPPGVAELAADWRRSDAPTQIKLAFQVSQLINGAYASESAMDRPGQPSLRVSGPAVDDWLAQLKQSAGKVQYVIQGTGANRQLLIWDEVDRFIPEDDEDDSEGLDIQDRDADSALPRRFLRDDSYTLPNCLGIAMLLCGFAQLAGSPYLLCSYLEHYKWEPLLRDRRNAFRHHVRAYQVGCDDLKEDLDKANSKFRDDVDDWLSLKLQDFHAALVIQLADGTWLLIDPYQKNVAVLPESYEAGQAATILRQYGDLYPGLTVLGDDGGALEAELDAIDDLYMSAENHADAVLSPLREELMSPASVTLLADRSGPGARHGYASSFYYAKSFYDAEEELRTSDAALALEIMLRQHPDWNDYSLDNAALAGGYRGTLEIVKAYIDRYGGPLPDDLFHEAVQDAILTRRQDEDARGFGGFAEAVHTLAHDVVQMLINQRIDDLWSGLKFPHPILEFMLPDYYLGLLLVSQIRSWTRPKIDGRVLLRYGASQLLWHEAVELGSRHYDDADPVTRRIESLVRLLPHHYPVVRNKLDYLDQRRVQWQAAKRRPSKP